MGLFCIEEDDSSALECLTHSTTSTARLAELAARWARLQRRACFTKMSPMCAIIAKCKARGFAASDTARSCLPPAAYDTALATTCPIQLEFCKRPFRDAD
eukprot:TRINITY_DN60088_c0_g1_i1.p1 TRINITY_DN60088_c0_g1~~TRINITY_DN60088_c0_g1_i1.p1  ORF type:complete len:100 (-),score=20.30 TRINITY_DN60088_c0_g1_i1:847-1146(-)